VYYCTYYKRYFVNNFLILIFLGLYTKRCGDGIFFIDNLYSLYSNTLYNEVIINTGGHTMVSEPGCFRSLTWRVSLMSN